MFPRLKAVTEGREAHQVLTAFIRLISSQAFALTETQARACSKALPVGFSVSSKPHAFSAHFMKRKKHLIELKATFAYSL